MDKTSTIYIAGHRGMVGSALIRMLQAKGYKNLITCTHSELDLTCQEDVERFFAREKPEYVFLAAAKVGGIVANNTYKAEFIYDNIMIAANVINAAYRHGVKKLLNLGSSCIYPKFAQQPLREDSLLTGSLEPTNEPYAIAKIAAVKMCRYYNEQFGTDYISAMPTNLYGPNDNYNLETSHVLPAFIRKFHLAKLLSRKDFEGIKRDILSIPLGYSVDSNNAVKSEETMKEVLRECGITAESVGIWGAGEAYREFLHVDDLADACIVLMEKFSHHELGEFINIGTGKDMKIKDIALLVKEVVGFKGHLRHDTSKPDGTPRKLLDIGKAKKLGWEAQISIKEGIRMTYDSYSNMIQQNH